VSNPDSFIEEVTEEVRRDKLFRLFRKYGWIGIVAVLGVVVGTGVNEWRKAQAEARAEAFGDAILEALDQGGAEERRAALTGVPADGEQAHLMALILGSDPAEDKAATLAALDGLIADAGVSPVYRDLAVLRRAILVGADAPLAERRAALQEIAAAGRPYRVLAAEQLAYLLIEEGKVDEAIAALQALAEDQDASGGLKGRAGQMITALGGTPAPAAGAAEPTDG
jgi:hypothetical protein